MLVAYAGRQALGYVSDEAVRNAVRATAATAGTLWFAMMGGGRLGRQV